MKSLLAGPLLAAGTTLSGIAVAADSAVILMYHRFGESKFPSTNIRLEQFEAHIAELNSGGYQVLPVSEIVRRMQGGEDLPELTIGLTVDDGFKSVYTKAWPRLRAAGLPFTVFLSTDHTDRSTTSYMRWEQIREMKDAGVEFGAHTASHPHMMIANLEALEAEIDKSHRRFKAELDVRPVLFAYPFGEAGVRERRLIRKSGYRAAFGQHSGVFHRNSNMDYIPRFALNESFGRIERFRLVANTLPLPVKDMAPLDAGIGHVNPPNFGFSVAADIGNLGNLGCFASSEGRLRVEILGASRIEVRLKNPLPKGRTRINCTLRNMSGRWRWLGTIFYVPPN
ncbi:MAG: polysaccharide deacetylase family protein [Pseudomonadota bacterium]|nr:polysaccharide deacetylase family protein [Pseudomonadota bacterium]